MTPDPALLERIAASLQANLRPVRPMPPAWALSAALFAIFAAVALSGAGLLGFIGFHRLSPDAIAAIFPPLAALALLTAGACTSAMIPGSKRPYSAEALLAAACVVMAGVFVFLFHDYRTDSFVRQGIACLKTGLLWATPAAIGAWLLLRRGFAVDRKAAGIAAGTFAGLAGVTVLELHCPNFRMPHIVVWHLAVLPIAAVVARTIWPSARKA
jgi:hypothetical protein